MCLFKMLISWFEFGKKRYCNQINIRAKYVLSEKYDNDSRVQGLGGCERFASRRLRSAHLKNHLVPPFQPHHSHPTKANDPKPSTHPYLPAEGAFYHLEIPVLETSERSPCQVPHDLTRTAPLRIPGPRRLYGRRSSLGFSLNSFDRGFWRLSIRQGDSGVLQSDFSMARRRFHTLSGAVPLFRPPTPPRPSYRYRAHTSSCWLNKRWDSHRVLFAALSSRFFCRFSRRRRLRLAGWLAGYA